MKSISLAIPDSLVTPNRYSTQTRGKLESVNVIPAVEYTVFYFNLAQFSSVPRCIA